MKKEDLKKSYKKVSSFLSQKKVQNIIVLILLLGFIILGTHIRVQNLPLLVDQTTGDYIPLALDPYYFLRISETIIETGGNLPATDNMHYQALNVGWHQEILPKTVVLMYKVTKIFSPEISLRLINVLSPITIGSPIIVSVFIAVLILSSIFPTNLSKAMIHVLTVLFS